MPTSNAALPTGTVTFLFTDIEGSTRMLQQHGEGYRDVQDAHFAIMRDAIALGGGHEVSTEGDAFFVSFPNPHGAVRAAVAAQLQLAQHQWPEGISLRIRMGLHTGEGTVSEGHYLSMDVNRAARIAAAGHGGQVLISESTRGLVEHQLPEGVSLRDLGFHRLKDLPHPEKLHQLVIDNLPSDFPPLKSLDSRPNNLPLQLTSFVGRSHELSAIIDRLRETRLLTLSGPGGTGKTRLALEVAGDVMLDFAGGVFFVDLSPVAEPDLVPAAISTALSVRDNPSRPQLENVREYLLDKELLLVLDNFEQVLPAADGVDSLLKSCPQVKALVTSRSVLRLYGEQEFPVPPMSLPDSVYVDPAALAEIEAVALFTERATAVNPGFKITPGNARDVAAICVRLDGLPLAIELAASRANLLSPAELLSRLEERLSLLVSAATNLPARQRTLRGALEWSYDLLDQPQRRLLARASVFAGGATVSAVDSVANPGGDLGIDTLDALASLVGNSLLRRREVAGESRFLMLETVREFGHDQLVAAGEEEGVRDQHAAWCLDLCRRAEPEILGPNVTEWYDRLDAEHDNLRTALAWTLDRAPRMMLEMTKSLYVFWQARGHSREGRDWMEAGLTRPELSDRDSLRQEALLAAGTMSWMRADHDAARRELQESADIAGTLGDRGQQALALAILGQSLVHAGDLAASRAAFDQGVPLAREVGDPFVLNRTLTALADLERRAGNDAETVAAASEALAISEQLGIDDMIGFSRFFLGTGLRRTDPERARAEFIQALDIFDRVSHPLGLYAALAQLVDLSSPADETTARLIGAVDSLLELSGVANTDDDYNAAADRARNAVVEALGRERAEVLFAEGRTLDQSEVADLAHQLG